MKSDVGGQEFLSEDVEVTRSILDKLLTDSQLYTSSQDYKDLLDFVVRMRNFAPFNAMLLQVQKPGLRFAASAHDWYEKFRRYPRRGARPLLILWPFGPVALVYDVLDTVGRPLPADIDAFPTEGYIDPFELSEFIQSMESKGIQCSWIDTGDGKGGSIRLHKRASDPKKYSLYLMEINKNHEPPVQFITIAHELAHLFLGHLGPDKKLKITDRSSTSHGQCELEAESIAYLVCRRFGIVAKSETYLKDYVGASTTVGDIDIYQVMRVAGQIETLLGIAAHMKI